MQACPRARERRVHAAFTRLLGLLLTLWLPAVCEGQVGPRALPSLLDTPRMLQATDTTFVLAGAAGVGVREPLGDAAHAQPLVMGALGGSVQTRSGFGAELRVDGRLELDGKSTSGTDSAGSVGAPRAYLRYARALHNRLSLGAELGLWVPGGKAPSLRFEASTLDALVGVDARLAGPWSLIAAAGFRFDQSAKAFPNSDQLSQGDFVALGLSDSHAVLARLGAQVELTRAQLFAEWTWDVLIGQQAPALLESPMHVALGARTALTRDGALRLLSSARALVSQRPEVWVQGPLVPFPARGELWLGLSYALGGQKKAEPEPQPVAQETAKPTVEEPPPATPAPVVVAAAAVPVAEPAPPPPSGQVRLLVRDNQTGEALLASVEVKLLDAPDEPAREHRIGADGRLEITLPAGRYSVEIKLYGWRKQVKTIAVEDQSVTLLDVGLHARSKHRERER